MEAAVKVVHPTAVANFMGSVEGFGGASGVVVHEAEGLQPKIASSFGVQKVNASSPVLWTKMPDSELRREASPISSFPNDDTPKNCGFRNITSLSLKPEPEDKLSSRKSGKISRNNSGCTKRSRMAQTEVSTCKTGLIDVNGISTEFASCPSSSNITEKTQVAKQKNNSNGKRGDKRNGKFPKSRCELLSLKNGLVSFNSAAGSNNFFGVYGLKPDAFDITKHIHELSFYELLDGSYNCPSTTKDKGKKATNSNDNLLNSVRKACSVLRLQKAVLAQKCAENDNSNISTGLLIAGSTTSQYDGDKDPCTADLTSSDKVQESCEEKIKASTSTVDSPLYNPKDILERLALPPPKDLDSLLLDAARPSSASRNNTDSRLGKTLSQRTGLPPFPWSHAFSGHNKSVTDAAKLSSSRTICQGRWVKVKNISSLQEGSTGFLEGLESLVYNPSLVPTLNLKSGPPENEVAQITSSERVLSMSEACSTSKVFPVTEEHPPSHLAAAQMLCKMATHSLKQNPSGVRKLLKKPSQMSMKTCKLKSVKSEKLFAVPKPKTGPENLVKVKVDDGVPSKKLRLSVDVKNNLIGRTISGSKEPVHLSALRSIKSSPSKLFRVSAAETKTRNPNFVKKSCGISLLSRVVDKPNSSSSEQKSRKAVPLDWNQADDKIE